MPCQCATSPGFWGYVLEHPEVIGITIATIVAVLTWFINANLARNLQRKQLAIETVFRLSEASIYVEAVSAVFSKIRKDESYDWKSLVLKARGAHASEDDRHLSKSLVNALNYCESVSIAILNDGIDEKVIKWSQRSIFIDLYNHTHPFIEECHRIAGNKRGWCNYLKLVNKWINEDDKDKVATPTR